MDAFCQPRLEAAIISVLERTPETWMRSRAVAQALADQGFGPLEPLSRHVQPMLELMYLSGRVECLASVGSGGSRNLWRLAVPSEDAA